MFLSEQQSYGNNPLWGLVLAAGDGRRLEKYVRQLKGKELPKQYVNFIGRRSMLEHTFRRAESLIPASRILTIVSRDHMGHAEVRAQTSARPAETVIVQPENKETGPGVLLPLMHLYKRCPEAIVAVFPSDHFILEEERLMVHVDLATQAVVRDPGRIVLLATEAQWPEPEYGYVVPCDDGGQVNLWGARPVARFVEKPDFATACKLGRAGGLWNTMIMVFKVKTLLAIINTLYPDLMFHFHRILAGIGRAGEKDRIRKIYRALEPLNFSKGILEPALATFSGILAVLPVLQVFWSDWGTPRRISEAVEILGRKPPQAPSTERRPPMARKPASPDGPTGSVQPQPRPLV